MFERLYLHDVTLQYSCKKVQSTTGKKKNEINISNYGDINLHVQTKIDLITRLKQIINEFGRRQTGSDNFYFTNNKEALLAVLTTAGFFCAC